MKRIRYLLFILTISLLFNACSSPSSKGRDNEKPILSTTVLPVAGFIEKIAGEEFVINTMVPAGMPPVAYEPTPKQMIALENSDIYFSLAALPFEITALPKIKNNNQEIIIVNISQGVDVIIDGHNHGHHHGIDPHMWMSPVQARQIAKNIYASLIKRYPEKKDTFNKNLQVLMAEINEADEYINGILRNTSKRSFMIYHPALTYMAQDYGLEQIPIEIHGKEPSPEYLSKVITVATKKNINLIFIQKQFDSNFARIVAEETQSKVVVFDPLSKDWSNTIYFVADALNQ